MELTPLGTAGVIMGGFLAFMGVMILAIMALGGKLNERATRGKVIAEIWEPSGFPVRHLVDIAPDGKTVEVDNATYALPKEPTPEEAGKIQHHYPARRYVLWSKFPIGNKVTLRIESWEKDNPEPIRPTYERPTVTSQEWTAQKRAIQATALAMRIQENEARQKQLENAIANQPNKVVVYIGLAIVAIIGIVTAVNAVQAAGGIKAFAAAMGIQIQ